MTENLISDKEPMNLEDNRKTEDRRLCLECAEWECSRMGCKDNTG